MKETKKNKIAVIGCGWLGQPLCECLKTHGYDFITTTTSEEKRVQLAAKYQIVRFDIAKDPLDKRFLECDILIYNIPPVDFTAAESFFRKIPPSVKCLFISSTSVYGKSQGACTEESTPLPETKSGSLLLATEHFLRGHFLNVTVIRPGGLFGDKRHPIHFLAGKKDLTTGQELLHLVHRDDCVKAIIAVIEKNLWNETFNLVNDLRIPKENYYSNKALELGLTPPQYTSAPIKNPTNLSNEKSKKSLNSCYIN